ncbi:MAG: recombinase family protein [Lachnoclostridium sp.]|jgi:site-specific DNA recombinase|nr:recombinase family protein [Lachnoclostridium sp.]
MNAKKEGEKSFLSTAIYVRVSTEEQAQEGFSIRAQIEKLKAYALLKEWEIYDVYKDEGISGKNVVDRPAINRMIEDIKNRKVNNVLVYKIDRLTRSTKNLIELVDLFEEHKCVFNSLTESIDTDSPSGRMFLKIMGVIAEFERENLASRLRLGFERKVKEGYTLANYSLSYGYVKGKGEKVQHIQPDEAKIVKEIFSMYVDENISITQIAKKLNERRIKTKRNALAWDAGTVKMLLTNPTYIGKVRYSTLDKDKYFETDGHHERLISDELFNLVQEKIANMPKYSKTKQPKEDNYYCGVLVCGMCGSKFTTHNQISGKDVNGKNKYKGSYRCMKKLKYHFPDEITCKCPDISHAKIETAFIDYIKNVNDFTEIESVNIENNSMQEEIELLDNITDCEKKISNLQDRKKQLMEQYVSEELEFEEYRNMLDIINEKYDTLNKELQRLNSKISIEEEKPNISQEDIISNLNENWEYLNSKEKMIFLRRFVNKIVISVEKERRNSSIATIKNIEFNLSREVPNKDKSKTSLKSMIR